MISFRCSCGKFLSAPEESAGQVVSCPECQMLVAVPVVTTETTASPPAPPPLPSTAHLPLRPLPDDPRYDHLWLPDKHQQSPPTTSGKAIAGFILGLVSFCLPVLLSIPAIVFGCLALGDVRRGRRGKGLAVTSIVIGSLTLAACPIGMVLGLPYAIQKVREAAVRLETMSHLKQIALDMHHYHDAMHRLPSYAIFDDATHQPLLSWRVAILQYGDAADVALFKQFHLDEPWDSPHNLKLLARMPEKYQHPVDPDANQRGHTHFQVFVGMEGKGIKRPIFVNNPAPMTLGQVAAQRGPGDVFLVVEATQAVPWTAPEDLFYATEQPVPPLGYISANYFLVAFANGSVVQLNHKEATEEKVRRAIVVNDGQPSGLGDQRR